MPYLKLPVAGDDGQPLRPANWFAPFSGDVMQAINPWKWSFSSLGGQVGLVNINLGKSADPALEQRILDDVGSYGRQLGRIGEVLEVLLNHVDLDGLAAKEREAVEDFRLQLAQVKRLKARHGRA
jgi:hypothetical protein